MQHLLNKIHHSDCIQFMDSLPAESISCIVTSPPYNMREFGSMRGIHKKGMWANFELNNGYDTHADDMPYNEYVAWQRNVLKSAMRILKEDGVIFYNHKWRIHNGLLVNREDIVKDFPVRQIIIWHRSGGINFTEGFFVPTYEVL